MHWKTLKRAVVIASLVLPAAAGWAQSTYSNAVMTLNPVGYWPMHEAEGAAPGDIETNYGTLGPLGTGYYPDWATPANGAGIKRGASGALANDTDQSVDFVFPPNGATGPAAGTFTNALYVPHTSPLSTLNPPFSVECWFYPVSGNDSEDIWGQNGYEGVNTGNAGAGVGKVCGIRLVWENGTTTGFEVYTYKNSSANNVIGFSGVTGQNVSPINNWYHLVVTCDAQTNISLYTNGILAFSKSAVTLYSPDYWTPITIGGARGGTKAIDGNIDEFAVYTNAISDAHQHYADGISESQAGTYVADVKGDNAAIYLRMDAPATYVAPASTTWPLLINYGQTNGVTVGSGVYTPGTMPGVVEGPYNPVGVPVRGLLGPTVPLLSGLSSFADAGSASIYNPTGSNANFTVTALFRGNPCDNRIQSIVGHGTNSWQLTISTNGCIVFNAGNGNKAAGGTGQAAGDMTSAGVYNDGYWHQVVAVDQTNVISLYVDGQLNTNGTPSGIAPTNIIPGNALDVMIGADPNYTNIPAGAGRQFAGQICDVAFFTNALTLSQVQGLFNAAGVVPYISTQPVSAAEDENIAFTNIVTAGGSGPLVYQWYKSGAAVAGQTNADLIFDPLAPDEAGTNYYLVITNNYGSVTSAVVSLTVYSAPTISAQYPVTYTNVLNTNYLTLYAGASPTFSISAAGLQPISYYWFTNGILDGALNQPNLTNPDVQVESFTAYCLVSNSLGSITSAVWSASVIADPLNSTGGLAPYPQSVLSLNPIGYWRLNETEEGNGDDGYIAHDYAGGNDGIYTNVILQNSGYNSSSDPSDTSAQFGEYGVFIPVVDNLAGQVEGIDFGTPSGSNAEFTVEAWVNGFEGTGAQVEGGAIATKGLYGISDEFNLGVDSTKVHYRFYVRSANGTMYVVGSGTSPAIDGNWHHVVGVCDEANGVLSLYYDGQLAKTNPIPIGAGLYEAPNPLTIGAATSDGTNYIYQFYGNLNDVAVFNYAMNGSQVESQFVSPGVQPILTVAPPTAVTTDGNGPLVISATAIGTPPIGYQWYDVNGGTNVAEGVTNDGPLNLTLTVSNVPPAWNGDQLELVVTNAYGSTNVYVALDVITNPPQITANLPSSVTVYTGASYIYSIGAIGPLTLNYQWYEAGNPITGQTNPAYTVTAGSPGTATYYVVITNIFGAVTSSVSTFTTTAIPQLTSAYETNVLGLSPVGFWPMHEVESPAAGDMEVNYGSLGLLGAGFYPDWTGNSGAFLRGYPGPLANGGDEGVEFTYPNNDNGALTNSLFIPHTTPLSTLNPPFSVECWFYPTNNNQGDIWSQSGDSGLNSGPYASGNGNVCGMRLDWNGTNGGFSVFSYYNNSSVITLVQQSTVAAGKWYHLVVTCDANTNVTLCMNGSAVGTAAAVGQYSPDFWTPFRVGSGNGNTVYRAVAGIISEVAVYTNVLSDVSTHYNDGVSAPGSYFAAVTNDNPVIYLRMNSTNYVAPPASAWPLLINYGSADANGVYDPGTAPGIVNGPSIPNGMSFEGLSGNVPQFNGVSSFADAGYTAAYNPIGSNSFSVAAMFRGNPCDGRTQAIVGHSTNSWGIWMNTSGNLVFVLGANTPGITSSGVYNDGSWHQVVAVYSPGTTSTTPGTASLYVDGALDTSVSTVSTNGIEPGSTMDVMIGSDPQFTNNPVGLGAQFAGQVCEVALFTNALTATQVQTLQSVAGVAPYITGNPVTGRTVNGGVDSYIYFGVLANGGGPLAYQWYFNASSNYNGATALVNNGVHYINSTTLQVTVTNLTAADSGFYFVVITNSFGSVTSRLASLSVDVVPGIVSQSPTGNITLYASQSAALSVVANGAAPLIYQWLTNGVPDTTAGTTSTYVVPPAQVAMTGFRYECVITNSYGSVTSAPVTLIAVVPLPSSLTNSLYGSNVLTLKPVAYWPMHEVESAAPGDIETNYGSLGLLGTAYYPDWATPMNGSGIKRGAPGALANDPDQSVYFIPSSSGSTGPAAGTFTNALYIPHTSPQATLNPPFSVECWFYPTNNASQDIWGQSGYEGLNSGTAGNAQGNVCGIRLVWENNTTTGFEIYTYRNGSANNVIGFSGTSGQNVSPIGNWYHLVVTCDAETNISLYTNGVLAFTTPAVTLYSPDYWTPLTIGGARGGTKAVAGNIDEFAVYPSVITDIGLHYSDGIGESQAGTYVADVQNDKPLLYYRMDAPAVYTPPAASIWPTLTNYGTIGGFSGVYSPGTMPGIVQGPFETNGVPLVGLSGGEVAQLSGMSSFADAGYSTAFNPTGSNANFTVAAMFRGNPCDNRVQSIVGHGNNSWQLTMTTSGRICFNAGNGNGTTEGTGGTAGDLSTADVYNDGNWHQVVAVNTTNVISIYVDGRLDNKGTPSGIGPTNLIPGNTSDVMIGSDPDYTNDPAGAGRQFAGQICEVALFANALTAGQIGGLYVTTATNLAPFFAPAPPTSASAAPGATLVVPAGADGTGPIYYQWQIITNSVTNTVATGSTNGLPLNASLTVSAVPAGWNSGQLELTVTNSYGASTALVALSIVSPVNPNPTNIVSSVTNNQLMLSWPTDHIGWTLQTQTNGLSVGLSTNWVNVVNSQTTNEMVIPINLTNGTVFYRLIYTNN